MYPGDLELFELVPLCREFIDNSWERPRIYCDKEGMEYMQLEDKFTDLLCYTLTIPTRYITSASVKHRRMMMVIMC